MVTAAIHTAFDQADAKAAHRQWRKLVGIFSVPHAKLAELIDTIEHNVLAYKPFPVEH